MGYVHVVYKDETVVEGSGPHPAQCDTEARGPHVMPTATAGESPGSRGATTGIGNLGYCLGVLLTVAADMGSRLGA